MYEYIYNASLTHCIQKCVCSGTPTSSCVCTCKYGAYVYMCTNKAVVHSEEGHLTRLIEQVGERYEGIGRVQVEDEHCSDEGHSLHL